jgi:hypothetical protein
MITVNYRSNKKMSLNVIVTIKITLLEENQQNLKHTYERFYDTGDGDSSFVVVVNFLDVAS